MGQFCEAVSGQGCPGTLTHQKLVLLSAIYPGLSRFIEDCFPGFEGLVEDFPYPSQLYLAHHIKLQKTSDIAILWGTYVEYPLPTEHGTCAMATGISEKMGGPPIESSSTLDSDSISNLEPGLFILQ